jgi:DNA-binding transcriptional ArsR family regulator
MDAAKHDEIEQGELFRFFKERSDGVGHTFEQLYRICTGYADTFALSREVNRLVKLKLITKRDKHYFYVDPTKEIKKLISQTPALREELGVVEPPKPEPKPAPRIHLVERKEPPKPAEPEPKPEPPKMIPFGRMRRGSAATPIALTFYYNQQEEFCTADLTRRTGVNQQVASQTVRRLVEEGIVVQTRQEGRSPFYKWAGKVRYPFPEVHPEDRNWKNVRVEQIPPAPNEPGEVMVAQRSAKVDGVEVVAGDRVAVPPVASGNLVVLTKAKDAALVALDAVIERYEMELAALRASREAYVQSKQ